MADEPIKIFVGTDRSQRIGLRVLEYSIGKHTQRPFEVHSLESVQLPEPKDKRNVQRTGFSFSRFAIPELCEFKGKAIYMDADMLVFKDIGCLWDIPFGEHKLLIQAEVLSEPRTRLNNWFRRRARRPKQTAVSLLDCSSLNWDAKEIIAGLDGQYNYKELMSDLCILKESEIGYTIPPQWNSLEHFDSSTCNLHYTDMQTQPWVCASNPLGYLWLNTLREMLSNAQLNWTDLEEEVRLGYARPSLLIELEEQHTSANALTSDQAKIYAEIDRSAGFEMHKAAYAAKQQREESERSYLQSIDTSSKQASKSLTLTRQRPVRILFVANSPNLPTLQIGFTKPLAGLVGKGLIETHVLTEWMINENSRIRLAKSLSQRSYIDRTLSHYNPDLLVFCRYTGLRAEYILNRARLRDIPVVNCLDDELLNVPVEIGLEKYNYYRDEQRQARMRYLLEYSDVNYFSTPALSKQIETYGLDTPSFTASVFCPAPELRQPNIDTQRFGYMGFGHEHDIKEALPGIVHALRHLPNAEFELFGTIPKPEQLNEFGSRVRLLEPEWDYEKFLQQLASRCWAVGICPLANLPFNEFKTSTKWLEYSAVGAAVIASDHSVYRRVINSETGVLIKDTADWGDALVELLTHKTDRDRIVTAAQNSLQKHYSQESYERQFDELLLFLNDQRVRAVKA